MLQQDGVDFGRVDVHPAGDDEVGGAVGQEQEALVVHVAHVAQGEVVAPEGVGRSSRRRRSSRTCWRPGPAGRPGRSRPGPPSLPSSSATLTWSAQHRAADRAGVGQPRRRVDQRAQPLGGGVVLDHDRAQPLDEPLLDARPGRARRRGSRSAATRGRTSCRTSSGRASRRWNMVGTMWVWVMPCSLDEAQRLGRDPSAP